MVARGCAWLVGPAWLGGAYVVAGGPAWLWGGMWLQGVVISYDEIRSMSGRYASYWNAFLSEMR